MMAVPFFGNSDEEEAMCWRSAHDYDLYARTRSRPAGSTSKPARSLVEVLRDLFRPRRPQVREQGGADTGAPLAPEVVPFPAGAARSGDRAVDREGSRAA
jgi:hypothetical protein